MNVHAIPRASDRLRRNSGTRRPCRSEHYRGTQAPSADWAKLILVTGRELPDLEQAFPEIDLFDRIVAENGAVLLNPATRERRVLGAAPPEEFVQELRARGVSSLSVGHVIVATWHPHETAVLESIRSLGLDLQVIFNKDAVMVLPAGVNKMTGLDHALEELKLSRHNVIGVGDAENDLAFVACCECSVAVANALDSLKERVDLVTGGERGAGVSELIERVIQDDLHSLRLSKEKCGVLFGRADDREIHIDSESNTILVCGQSGGGKSTFVAGFVERLIQSQYQVCLIDPEGDYENMAGLLTLGDEDHGPSFEQIFQLLDSPASNLVFNLVGIKMQDRPGFFSSLLTKLQEMKIRDGRPHWIIVDEAHHLLPSEWAPAIAEVAGQKASLFLVTVHPGHVSPAVLRLVNILAVIGSEPARAAEEFSQVIGIETPAIPEAALKPGEVSVWFRDRNEVIANMQSIPSQAERKRHRRKYAEGQLEPERVFYFRGPEQKMNLRAQNLMMFLQIAEGVDDDTWLFHLRGGDYSNWLTEGVKDAELGETVRRIEQDSALTAAQTRQEIAKAIQEKYTVAV